MESPACVCQVTCPVHAVSAQLSHARERLRVAEDSVERLEVDLAQTREWLNARINTQAAVPCPRLHVDPCSYCGQEQSVNGGLEFGPPGPHGFSRKRRVCVECVQHAPCVRPGRLTTPREGGVDE